MANKGIRYFFSRFWQNAKHSLSYTLYVGGILALAVPPIGLAICATFPVTVLITSLIKTAIDYRSRKPLSRQEIENTQAAIELLSPEALKDLATLVKQYENPKSRASVALINSLLKGGYTKRDRTVFNELVAVKKRDLQLEVLGPHAEQIYKENVILAQRIGPARRAQLRDYRAEQIERLAQERHEHLKTKISDYMTRKHNNGKKLMCMIHGFFATQPPAGEVIQTETPSETMQEEAWQNV